MSDIVNKIEKLEYDAKPIRYRLSEVLEPNFYYSVQLKDVECFFCTNNKIESCYIEYFKSVDKVYLAYEDMIYSFDYTSGRVVTAIKMLDVYWDTIVSNDFLFIICEKHIFQIEIMTGRLYGLDVMPDIITNVFAKDRKLVVTIFENEMVELPF